MNGVGKEKHKKIKEKGRKFPLSGKQNSHQKMEHMCYMPPDLIADFMVIMPSEEP